MWRASGRRRRELFGGGAAHSLPSGTGEGVSAVSYSSHTTSTSVARLIASLARPGRKADSTQDSIECKTVTAHKSAAQSVDSMVKNRLDETQKSTVLPVDSTVRSRLDETASFPVTAGLQSTYRGMRCSQEVREGGGRAGASEIETRVGTRSHNEGRATLLMEGPGETSEDGVS